MKKHKPLTSEAKAFVCADCGAVALKNNKICKLQGLIKKSDWCGTKSLHPYKQCKHKKCVFRFECQNCGQISMDAELLCKPKKIDLSANYDYNYSNIELDTLYANAPFSQNLYFSANYRIQSNNSVNLAMFMRNREDRSDPKLFDYTEYTGRLTVQNKIGRLGSTIYGELGKFRNHLEFKLDDLRGAWKIQEPS